ncbi:MAG: phage portal protein [Actinomycetota bacterium]|nr:phage portal protein [Actinomycetota bacterium]
MKRSYPPREGPVLPIGDPALAGYLGYDGWNDSGEPVSERSSLSVTAVYRAVSIIASTVAGLPLKSYRDDASGVRLEVNSVWDDPGAGLFTRYEFVHLCMVHLCLHGNAFLLHVYNGAGQLSGFFPVHPSMVEVRFEDGRRIFQASIPGHEAVDYTEEDMTQVMLFSLDGLTGESPISLARNAIGTSIAADRAAARMFKNGFMLGGMVSSDEHLSSDDATAILAGLKAKMSGSNNASDWAFVNASLKLTPWTMNADDADFIEQRTHQVTEIARIFGIPKVLLAEDGASTWGSGIAELDRGMAKYTLRGYTTPFEQRATMLTRGSSFVEFDYAGLLQGTPKEEIELLGQQIALGLLTVDEARAIRNLPPLGA